MTEHFISVRQASEQSGYSPSHIRNLLSKGVLDGQKFANVWMVNCQSLEAYKAVMAQLGAKKHGAWAATSTVVEASR